MRHSRWCADMASPSTSDERQSKGHRSLRPVLMPRLTDWAKCSAPKVPRLTGWSAICATKIAWISLPANGDDMDPIAIIQQAYPPSLKLDGLPYRRMWVVVGGLADELIVGGLAGGCGWPCRWADRWAALHLRGWPCGRCRRADRWMALQTRGTTCKLRFAFVSQSSLRSHSGPPVEYIACFQLAFNYLHSLKSAFRSS